MAQHHRSKGELKFYLISSILGLVAIIAALAFRGIPKTIIGWEMIGFGAAFFVGTLIWSARNLSRGHYSAPNDTTDTGGV
jgi:hypothetical protein